jgi:CRP-like cAMP-binding protein
LSLLDGKPRSATVTATEPSEFLRVPRREFLALLERHRTLAVRLMAHLARTLRATNEKVRSLAMLDARTRVLNRLLDLAQQHGRDVAGRTVLQPRPSVSELAAAVGCSRETASRAVAALTRSGHLRPVDGGIAIVRRRPAAVPA